MGVEAKLSNMSRRCAGRSMEWFGKIIHSTQWQLTGHTTWVSACDDETREKAKDAAKAMEAVAAYGLAGRLTPDLRATASGQAHPAGVPRFADSGTVSVSPPLAASTWPNAEPVRTPGRCDASPEAAGTSGW